MRRFLHSTVQSIFVLLGGALIVISLVSVAYSLLTRDSLTLFDFITGEQEGFLPFAVPAEISQQIASAPTLDPKVIEAIEEEIEQTEQAQPVETISTPDKDQADLVNKDDVGQDTVSVQEPAIPDRIMIPAIHLDAKVIEAKSNIVEIGGDEYIQWMAPDEPAAGWHTTSARLGEAGNTVINGHHNIYGKVFENLVDLKVGDRIVVFSGEEYFLFLINQIMVLPEKKSNIDLRLQNARWIEKSADVRLTLITCWPPESNTHRVIVVASPYEGSLR